MIAELHPVFDWLFAAKAGADSALCSVAFSINSGAASIDGVRFQVYDRIQRRISDRVGKVDESEWLARIEAMPDTSPEKAAFMLRYNELLDCFIQAKTRFSRENLEKGRLAKFVMSVAAVLSVVCIVFNWYCRATVMLLLPFPAFCFWYFCSYLVAAWTFSRKSRKVRRAFEKAFRGASGPVPTIGDLKAKLKKLE